MWEVCSVLGNTLQIIPALGSRSLAQQTVSHLESGAVLKGCFHTHELHLVHACGARQAERLKLRGEMAATHFSGHHP